MITVHDVSIDGIPEPDRSGLRDWCSQRGLSACYLAADGDDGFLGWFGYENKPAVMNRGSRAWGWVDERSDRGLYCVQQDSAMTEALCATDDEPSETVYRVALERQADPEPEPEPEPEPAPAFDPYKAMLA